jgi:hypothetical protein
MIYEWTWSVVGMITDKIKPNGWNRNPVSVPLNAPQIPHGIPW